MSGEETAVARSLHAGRTPTNSRATNSQTDGHVRNPESSVRTDMEKSGGPPREPAVWLAAPTPRQSSPGRARASVAREGGQLDDGTSAPCGEVNHQQDDADDEEDPGDLRRDRGHACRTKNTSNQSDD